MVSKIVVTLLLYISRVREGFIEACVTEPVFWLMQFGCIKTQRQKTGLCRLKG